MNRQQERLELERAMRQAGRLPPGQAATLKFPVLHMGPVPSFDPASWEFRVRGAVHQEVRWNWDEFNRLPRTRVTLDVHCVTRWSKFDTTWEGVSLQTLIDAGWVQPSADATYLLQHCEHGFTTNLPLSVALQPNFLLATHFEDEPLTPEHGYPLRGVIGALPGSGQASRYFWKGGKWLRGLEFLRHDRLGYWEKIRYHNQADVWTQQRWSRHKNVL